MTKRKFGIKLLIIAAAITIAAAIFSGMSFLLASNADSFMDGEEISGDYYITIM